jgi:hypothetical protein
VDDQYRKEKKQAPRFSAVRFWCELALPVLVLFTALCCLDRVREISIGTGTSHCAALRCGVLLNASWRRNSLTIPMIVCYPPSFFRVLSQSACIFLARASRSLSGLVASNFIATSRLP